MSRLGPDPDMVPAPVCAVSPVMEAFAQHCWSFTCRGKTISALKVVAYALGRSLKAAPVSGRGMVRRHPRQQQLLLQPPSDPDSLLDTPGRSQTL